MTLTVMPITGMPEVQAGDDLAGLIVSGLRAGGLDVAEGDVLVVSSKIASKAFGLTAPDRAQAIADETVRVVAERRARGRLTQVVQSAAGPVMAAAGVDASNTGSVDGVLVLPRDPDAVCAQLRSRLRLTLGVERLGVILSDTAGRTWRAGQVDLALGAAGVEVVDDLRGSVDADGRPLEVTERSLADEIASAADLVKGKADRVPVALVRGLSGWTTAEDEVEGASRGDADGGPDDVGAARLVRTGAGDWFAYGHVEAIRAALGVEPGTPLSQSIGIRSVEPESRPERMGRAVAVAVHDLDSVGVDVGPDEILVTGPDLVERGMAAARICVALFSEGLCGTVEPASERGEDAVRVVVAGD
jgi:coenzyme F420-0:L-glutamate ligase / coenzyme F420-1:gamma-L-glutamate ligase